MLAAEPTTTVHEDESMGFLTSTTTGNSTNQSNRLSTGPNSNLIKEGRSHESHHHSHHSQSNASSSSKHNYHGQDRDRDVLDESPPSAGSINRLSRLIPVVRPVYTDRGIGGNHNGGINGDDGGSASGGLAKGRDDDLPVIDISDIPVEKSKSHRPERNRSDLAGPSVSTKNLEVPFHLNNTPKDNRRNTFASKPSLLPVPTSSPSPKSKTPTSALSIQSRTLGPVTAGPLSAPPPNNNNDNGSSTLSHSTSFGGRAGARSSTIVTSSHHPSVSRQTSVSEGAAHIQQLHSQISQQHQGGTTNSSASKRHTQVIGNMRSGTNGNQQHRRDPSVTRKSFVPSSAGSSNTITSHLNNNTQTGGSSSSYSSSNRQSRSAASSNAPRSAGTTGTSGGVIGSRIPSPVVKEPPPPVITSTAGVGDAYSGGNMKLPLTPEATLHFYKDLLTPYEQREIFDFPEVYFAGAAGVEKIGSARRRTGADGGSGSGSGSGNSDGMVGNGNANSANSKNGGNDDDKRVINGGYDDSRGDYYLTNHDHVAYRYEVVSLLGKGSFGQVVKCYDHKKKTHVALKIIRNKKRFEKQGMVEVKVLDKLRQEDAENTYNIIHMLDYFYFRNHLCITFELLGINLYEWLKAGGFRGVHMGVIKRFALQIGQCMELLFENHIVHCDLKPENVLLCDTAFLQPSRCDLAASSSDPAYSRSSNFLPPDFDPLSMVYNIKVIDFGSSCFEDERVYTYVQSRFYRSPEVILGINYNVAIDMWSLGCILAEMYTGYPLFPGENEQEQLACIMEVLGVPPESLIERGSRRKLFFDSNGIPRIFPNSKGKKRRPGAKSLAGVLRSPDPGFVDFIERCLEWEPERRMTPRHALEHYWLRDYVEALQRRNAQNGVQQQQSQQGRGVTHPALVGRSQTVGGKKVGAANNGKLEYSAVVASGANNSGSSVLLASGRSGSGSGASRPYNTQGQKSYGVGAAAGGSSPHQYHGYGNAAAAAEPSTVGAASATMMSRSGANHARGGLPAVVDPPSMSRSYSTGKGKSSQQHSDDSFGGSGSTRPVSYHHHNNRGAGGAGGFGSSAPSSAGSQVSMESNAQLPLPPISQSKSIGGTLGRSGNGGGGGGASMTLSRSFTSGGGSSGYGNGNSNKSQYSKARYSIAVTPGSTAGNGGSNGTGGYGGDGFEDGNGKRTNNNGYGG
ncbi:Dual specificity tyrosine-phosphorylation-regulated kinase, partial [Blyttiomyces sp. JEL0837]